MVLAAGVEAADGAFSAGGVVSTVLAFLSVPAIVSGLAWLWQRLSPTGRLTARLTKDLAIYEKLPESPQRNLFAEQISEVLGRLVVRREVAPSTGKKERIGGWIVTAIVPLLVLGILLGIGLPIPQAPLDPVPDLPGTWVAAIAGAIAASVGLGLSALTRRDPERRHNSAIPDGTDASAAVQVTADEDEKDLA